MTLEYTSVSTGNHNVSIVNSLGQIVFNQNIIKANDQLKVNISTSDLSNGLYSVIVTFEEKIEQQKIVIQH